MLYNVRMKSLDIESIKLFLKDNGMNYLDVQRLANNTGSQLFLDDDCKLLVYDSGKLVPQGKNMDKLKVIMDKFSDIKELAYSNKVFVVYGHDKEARNQLELMLRRWKLEPVILDRLVSEGKTLIEKIEKCLKDENIGFAIVLATPDDEGHVKNKPDEKAYRARQNVVLELGMMLAKLGRERVAILFKQDINMEKPSDIQGLLYYPYKDDIIKDAGIALAKELNQKGYSIDIANL